MELDGARDECTNERRGELRWGGGPVLNGPRANRCDERGLVVVCNVECGVGDRYARAKLTVTCSLVCVTTRAMRVLFLSTHWRIYDVVD